MDFTVFDSFKKYAYGAPPRIWSGLSAGLIFISFLLSAYPSFAEGSKELNPTGGNRVYLYSSTNTINGSVPWANQGLVRVYVKANETIHVGSSVQGMNGGVIILRGPNNAYVSSVVGETTIGRINTRAQELAGPLPNAGGYTAFTRTITAAEEGVWSVYFIGYNNGSNPPPLIASNTNWTQPTNSGYIAAFDVSIRNSANTAFIPGRAYMNLLSGQLGELSGKFTGKLNVLTNDGYIYEVNPNGLAGYGFSFFSNNKGYKAGALPSYQSQDNASASNLQNPLSDDTATDITHKLFFNMPSSDLPENAPIRSSDGMASTAGTLGTTWLKKEPVSPVLTNFSFIGKEGTANRAGAISTMGGYFSFDANQTGNYSIKIDANKDGDFTDASDRIITNPAVVGTNTVFWDGLDGAGAAVTGSYSSSMIQVVLRAGEVHFPLLDVENNPNGIIITRANGVGSGDQTVYWNDANISSTTNPSSPLNTSVNGVSSATNGHKWGSTAYNSGGFGDEKGLDTWTYVFSAPVAPATPIEFLSANLEVLPITKSKTTGICIGQQQTYTVSVRNNGPSAVTDAKFNFTFPAELTGVVVTPVLTSGTASVVSSNIVGSQYNASLDMSNASVLTFTITGTVSSLPALNTLSVKATVMRPADVYDPDATNPDADIPTNPQSECDSAPSGFGCNNVQDDSTPVSISNISIANVSEAEGSGGTHNMTFTVTASPANASCDITVDYTVTHGTTNSFDFAGLITGSVTIPAGQATKTFTIPVATDQIIEANEAFTVTLSNPSSGGVITTGTATGTIVDDDNIPLNKLLVLTGTDGAEGVLPGVTFTIGFPTGITADKDTEIAYTLSGTATGTGTDYTGAISGTIIIPALTNSVTTTLPVIDDVVLEGNETVIVTTGTITSPYAGMSVPNSPLTLNIADDDNAILISGPAQVVEGNNGVTYVTFRVSLDITTSSPFTINYLTEDGIATSADDDYEAKSGTLNFTGTNPGEYYDIQIAINGDLKIEGNEFFKVKLDGLSNTFGGLLTISGSPATMSILDDDNNAANKTITITKVDGAEGGVPAEFIFSFPPGVSTDAATTISYTLGGVAEANGTDYNGPTTGTVTIAAGANSGFFNRTVVDDAIIEDSEAVTITTGIVTNSNYNGIGVSNSPFSLNILDNDNTAANNTITLSIVKSGSEPSTPGQFMVSYPAGIVRSTPTTVNYSIGGSSENDVDYTGLSGSVIIPAYTNSAVIDILVKDDQIVEPTETVLLALTSATSGSVSLNVTPGVQSINITDNDNIPANNVITLTKVSDAEEGLVDGQFKVSFPLGYTSSVATTVNYAITGTALNGTDYNSLTGQVIISAYSNSAVIDILVNDDLIIESTETISLGLSTATNSVSVLSVNPLTTVTADLRDNDNIAGNSIITLTKVSDGAEPGTNVEFLVSYPAGVTSAAATTVNYLISGTALNGTDYVTLTTSVTIPAGANSAPIIATVSDDQLIEATETIILTLTTATSSISVPGLTVNPATGVSADIIDDENTPANTKIILTKTANGAEPGTKAQFVFSYPPGIYNSAPTIVNYLVGGTAINGTDFTLPHSTTITIPANTNSVVMDALVSDDLIIEPVETITIDLITASSSTISTITLEPVGAVTANIDDNDNTLANKTISISKIDGVEGMLNGSFTFSFPPGIKASAPTDITFYLTGTADGSGTDYTASPSAVTITIPAGQNSVTLPLLVLEDEIIEDIETVILTTTGVSNADLPGIVVANSPQTLNISDNDDYTTLTVSNATVTEGNSGFVSMDFIVSLAKATGRSFSVKYTTEDGTATSAGDDYISKQDVLNFSGMPGESFTVSVQVKGDQMIEMNEAFKLKLYDLSDPFGGRLTFANSTATGTITDDDLIPANTSITITQTNGSETGPIPGSFTFSFPTGVSADAPTTINFGLSGTALSTDYTGAGSSSVTIPAGDNSFTLDLPVIDDALVENTETVILTSGSVSSPYGITVANSPQSLEIADNDNATLTISGASVAEGNSGTTSLSFTVTLDKATGSPFTVDYATSGGTATAGNDYTAKSGTLSFNGTAGSQTIVVSVTGDQKIEPGETFTVTISNLSSSFGNRLTIPVASSTATGTITNDDSGVITITSTDGMEAGLVPGTFTFSFPAGVTVDAPTTISYTLSGIAESGNDYTGAISGSVEIPANTNSYKLTLPVLADLVVEDTETVILTTGLITSPYLVTVGNSPQSLNIIDKDQAVLSLTGPATITEGQNGSQLATYTVTLNQATAGSFTVDYASSNGTATIADDDYESSSGRLTFAGTAGETETFTVQINGDQKIEADENFSVVLSNLISSFSNKPVVQSTPVVTKIVNDDSGVITITSTNGSETGPVPGTFTFSLPDGVTADVATVIYYGLSGTALSSGTNYDYTATPDIGSITIPANANSATVTLNVNDDAVIEGTETVILTVGALNSPYAITVANSSQSLNITDNDNAILSLTGGTVIEGNSGTQVLSFTVTLNKATSPFSVDYKTKDGSATIADNDYSALSGTLSFTGSAGESKIITVSIAGDQKIEANENLTIELSNLSNHYNNTLVINGSPATGTILDDDNTANNKRLVITTVNGAEGGANASMKFSYPDEVSSDGITSIPYTLGGTAQDNGIDYNIASTGILYIPAGENSVTLDLAINDDPFIEGTETAIVNAGIISNDRYTGLTLSNAPQTIFIADNDVASVSIAGPVTITEGNNGSQKAVFNVMLDKATGSGFSISHSTADGTALAADNDYIAVSNGTVVFEGKAGEVQKIEISIIGDKKIELNENYQVRLVGLSSDFGGALTFSNTSATGTIIDDDNNSSNRQIAITKSDGTEGAADGSFTFSLPAGISLDAPTTINYTLNGTAKGAGIDYNNSQVGSVVIKAGENYAVLTIDVVDDSGLEPSETVIVTTGAVTNNSYNGIAVLNSPHTLNIEDDDNASISISAPIQITEGNAGTINAVFRVTLNNSTGDPFTVNYTTKDGTATVVDNDYIASSGTLTFSGVAGEFENITVPVRGDLKIEKNERFTVELSGLSNDFDQRLLIPGLPAVGTIRDDDNTAANRRIIISRVNGAEGGNDARFKFSYQAGVSADDWTIVNYTLSGTALGDGADYAAASIGSVTIPPGENSALLDLAVIDDAVIEATETVILTAGTIENNSHAGLNTSNSPLSLNITDNDEGELKLSGPVLVQEGNSGPTLATFSVTLLGATGSPFSIGYATFDGTAKVADNDYVTKAANLNFQGTEGEVQTITILVNGDYKIESDEEFNLILRNLSNTFGDKLKFSGLPVKGRILNDDNGTITITKTDGKEGAGGGIFTFTLPAGVYSDKPIVIPYNLSGTALGNTVDYLVNTNGSVTIPAGLSKANLSLVINDDSIIEPAETVKVSTGIVLSSMPNAVLVENSPVELIIDDNDTAPIVITNPVIVKEGNSGYVTAVFSATLPLATAEGFTFDYATVDETAKTGDDDYVPSTGKLTFAGRAGEVQKISVQIKGDVKVEGDEKYLINLDNLSNTYNDRLSFEFPSVTGVIHDDDITPAAVSDFATTPEDVAVTFSLTANDNDPDGIDPTSIVIKTPPDKGDVKVNRDGTVTYTPAPDDNGMHQFTYTVKDLTGLESNEANVTVTVTPVSDPPVAEDDSFYVLKNGTLRENVSSNDADPDGEAIRFKVTVPPSNGTLVSFNETDGSFIYTPTEEFTGLDQFTYQVADAGGLTDDAVVTLGVQPKAKVKLSPTLVSVKEGEVVKITAALSEPLLQDVNLTIEYKGDAQREEDYTLSGDFTSFLIKAGDTTTTQEIVLTTVRDYVKEGDEVAEVNIATATPSQFVEIESGSEVTISELVPTDKPVGPDENGDIAPDPYTSPNGDGLGNESFVIQNITKYPDNEVIIFNRWGNEVFRVKGYDNREKAFTGVANAGLFVNKDSVLPDGVYYFIIHTKVDNVAKMNKGYVIIKR